MAKTSNYLKYSNKNPLQQWLIKLFLENIDSVFKTTKATNILDAGCGEGFVSRYLLAKNHKIRLKGLDVNKKVLLEFKKILPQTKTVLGDINMLPFQNDEFDLILAIEILEHLLEPPKALSEIKRVTKKFCLLSVPHEPFFRASNLLRGKNIRRFGSDSGHRHHWSRKAFLRLVESYFKIITVRSSFPWTIILGQK
jgi:ubiquinone/menaquinone biosynthesis C-methylase UbiE